MKKSNIFLLSVLVLIVAMATVSAADSDNNAINDNSRSDVAVDSSSSTTAQATDTSTHTDSSVDKTSDASATSSQKTDTTSQQTTQKVSDKTSENTQTTSDTTAKASSDTTSKASSDTSSQSTQSTSQSTQQVQSDSNTTNENSNTVSENVVDNSKSISTVNEDIKTIDTNESESYITYFNITESDVGDLDSLFKLCMGGETFNFIGNFSNLNMNVSKNITLTSVNGANFTNTTITLNDGCSGTTVSNLFINNTENQNYILKVNEGVDHLLITNNTFIINTTTQTASGINLTNSNYSIVSNNTIIVNAVSNNINYHNISDIYEGTADTYGIGIFNSSYVNVSNNNVTVSSAKSNGSASTVVGIILQGTVLDEIRSEWCNITNNKVSVSDENYAYGVAVHYNILRAWIYKNTIETPNGFSGNYACGVDVSGTIVNSSVMSNNINLYATGNTYGVVFTGSERLDVQTTDVSSNTINLSGNKVRAVEICYTNGSRVSSNVMNLTGNYVNGIGIGGSKDSYMYANKIYVTGQYLDESSGWDTIHFITSGIYVTPATCYTSDSSFILTSENSTMRSNTIETNGVYAINLTGNNSNITSNNVTSNTTGTVLYGNSAILVNGENNTLSGNYMFSGDYEELDTESTHIISQNTYENFFINATDDTPAGLSDLVNDGDILVIDGDIEIAYDIVIDKAVNLTTYNEGKISSNGLRLSITEGGSFTNVTNITLYNTEFFTIDAHNITIDHFNNTVVGIVLGWDTGDFSLRENSENITITNSYFHTENNGGHSNVVGAGASNVVFVNNTIVGVGEVGNLFYLTSYDTNDSAENGNFYVVNNTIIGPEEALSICYAMAISGTNIYLANNYINYTGDGIRGQWSTNNETDSSHNTCFNNTVVGTGISLVGANIINNTAQYIMSERGDVINNSVVNSLSASGDNITVANNTVLTDGNVTLNLTNSVVENIIMNGDVLHINLTGENNTFKDNHLNGTNCTLVIAGSNNLIENNTIHIVTNDPASLASNPVISVINYTYDEFHVLVPVEANNNIIQNNDLVNYDLYRDDYVTGDDCVYVIESATGNVVQNNYGNISEIIPGEGNYTYITYNVTSMAELISTLDDIKTNATYSNDTRYVINLLDGDYTVTEAITWGNGTGDVKEVIINGTNQTINGNGFNSTFLSIANGYSLTLDNVTFTDFILDSSVNTIVNDGNLTINNSIFDAGIIASENGSNLFINNTNFTQTAINNTESATRIDNSRFYDTDLSSLSIALIHNTGGNLTFFNNYVSNITATYFMNNEGSDPLLYMENNDISDLSCSIDISSSNSMNILNTMINNTFSNINSGLSIYQIGYFLTVNNTYNNCSIPTNITSIPNTTLTTDEFTTVVTVTTDIAYNTTVTDGQIVISINGVEYKSFDVINGSATITIESSAFTTRINSIEVAYEPISDNFRGSTTIFNITDPNVQSIMEYNVTSFEELKEALENVKTDTDSAEFVINLLDGDYTVTETLTWGDTKNDIKEITINGNGQSINLNGSTFIDVKDGYHLIINNVTIQNNEIVNKNSIENDGNLTIENSTFINAIIHSDKILTISYSNFTNTVFDLGMDSCMDTIESNANISNNYFYNTDVSQFSDDYKGMIYSHLNNLTFYNNTVENITGKYIIYNEVLSLDRGVLDNVGNCYIDDNTFKDVSSGIYYVYSDYPADGLSFQYQGGKTELINNTIINATNENIFDENQDLLTSTDYTTIENNTFIECNLDVSISSIPNTTISEDFTTTVNITTTNSLYKTTVNDGQVIVSINGKEYKTFDVSNGQATITIEASELEVFADNNIEVQYVSQDGSFKNATTTFTLTYKVDDGITITINQTTIYSGDTITLTAEVVNNESFAKDGYVIFKVNGKTVRDEDGNPIMVQVDENGKASLNYTIPDTNSNIYNITAVYNGENTILRSTPETLTTSLKTATIVVDQITAKAGQTVTLRAYITDQNGNAVSSGKLIFKLNGKTLKDANGNTLYATIVNGVATLNYTIPDNYSAKDYILTAVYQGTGFERSEANSTLTLTKSTPTIIPDSTVFGTNNTITINQGTESVNIKATIIDPETNAPIDTTTVVTIKINDKTVTQEYVSNGQIDMTIYTSSFKNPEYNITVVVGENSQYERTSFNGTLEIVTPNGLATSSSYNGTLLVKED